MTLAYVLLSATPLLAAVAAVLWVGFVAGQADDRSGRPARRGLEGA